MMHGRKNIKLCLIMSVQMFRRWYVTEGQAQPSHNLQLTSWSTVLLAKLTVPRHFMLPNVSSPCSQDHATWASPKPDQSSSRLPDRFLHDRF